MKRLLVLFSSCVAIAAAQTPVPVSDATKPVTITIGGRDIVVPLPSEGFVRCDGISDTVDKALSGFLPPTNRLLASFGTAADGEALRKHQQADMSTNFNIQTLRALETEEMGTKTFASVSGQIRKEVEDMKSNIDAEIQKAIDQGNRKITEETKLDSTMSVSDVAVLGFFDEANPSVLGFSMALKVGGGIGGTETNQRGIVSAYAIPANGRLLLLYASRPFNSEADRKEAERSVKAWGDAIIASNIKVEGKAISSGLGGLFKNVGRSGLIGAIVGGLAALVGIVIAKSRRGTA